VLKKHVAYIKRMSFLRITDPKKRDFIVQEFLKTKRNIQQHNLAEKTGDQDFATRVTKMFQPIIDSQHMVGEKVIKGVQQSIENIPVQPAITFPAFPSIEAALQPSEEEEEHGEEEPTTNIGSIAGQYLMKFASKSGVDKTFGLYDKDGEFYMGDKKVLLSGDNLIIDGKEYVGTPGIWELITSKDPDAEILTDDDYENYQDILIGTNAMRQNNSPASAKPKGNKSKKWRVYVKPIWDMYKDSLGPKSGEGVSTVIIPSDPNALLERFDLLMASKGAGNTGVQNELVSICDELLRQKIIDRKQYKKFMQ
jgi:hypothetical protein